MSNDIAISVKNVKKDFYLPHEKSSKSLKSAIINFGRRKNKEATTQHALKGISFDVKKGEFFGILGRNGSGKSTLLKMLAGIYQPTTGEILTNGKLVPFIELGVGFNPELSGRENVYLNGALLGFTRREISAMYEDIVEFAELEMFMDQKLKNYSSGMQVRLAFSVATRAKAGILLIDEVLAVGDADFQRKCYNYFRNLKKTDTTIVFVTHDMNAVKSFCDRAILIEDGEIIHSGAANKIADEYLQLFSGESRVISSKKKKSSWGSGDIEIEEVKVKANNLTIDLAISVLAIKDIEEYVIGYNFRTQDGAMIMGGNNLNATKNSRKLAIQSGEKSSYQFKMPNYLGTGEYQIDVIVRDANGTVFSKEDRAAIIKVTKSESYYPTIALAELIKINAS